MAKTQVKLRETASPDSRSSARFRIVRDGEPVPEIANVPLRKPVTRQTRSKRVDASFEPDACPLCGGIIERFDREVFLLHGRCAPCHEALEEK